MSCVFLRLSLIGAMLSICLASNANAGLMTFFGEDNAGSSLPVPNSLAAQTAFLSNLVGVEVEDFESIAVGTKFPLNASFGSDIATLTGTNIIFNTGVLNTNIAGRFAISGSRYLNVGTDDALSLQLTFSSPQAAFGFFAMDVGDVDGQLALAFDGGPNVVVPHTITANGSALFFGYINTDNPFTTVQFFNTVGNSDAFGFDDFTIGRVEQVVSPVPEPASMAIFAVLGSIGLIGVRRRRKKTSA